MRAFQSANFYTFVAILSIFPSEVIDFVQKVTYVPSWIVGRTPSSLTKRFHSDKCKSCGGSIGAMQP